MSWFTKVKKPLAAISLRKKRIPEGVWVKCDGCKEIIYTPELERNFRVCLKCGFHHRLPARGRVALLTDSGTFEERDRHLHPGDPLRFKDSKRYRDRIADAQKKTGNEDAIVAGTALLDGRPVEVAALDFDYMGGSMGSVVGEKITRAADRARLSRRPLIVASCSGGARMQEGILSLMQMAKTSAALGELAEARVPYISVLADPTSGGVTASFAMLGDVIMAEPDALICFAGPRVIEQTIGEKLPAGFQRSEFLLKHGFVDMVVPRLEMKKTISKLLGHLCGAQACAQPENDAPAHRA
ncbi:MAG: acetyl-CoA carboxylase carboxyltransferase subunit beta [Nitrospinae bacterium]|nr:acetyl-CoA carboxylase carboxyltransferase subunit beta [Nitrospinota bacterium]